MLRMLLTAALLAALDPTASAAAAAPPDRAETPAEHQLDLAAKEAQEALRAHAQQRNSELENLRTVTRLAIEGLETQIAKAKTPEAAQALQDRIGDLKQQERMESLQIQRRYALAIGNEDMVAEIDAAVERMLNPTVEKRTTPVVRPVPTRDGEDRR